MAKIKILFRLEYLYHKPALEALIETFAADERYDVAVSWVEEYRYYFWRVFRRRVREQFMSAAGDARFRYVNERQEHEEHFDVVVAGDAINRDAARFGKTLLCLQSHGIGMKTSLYRALRRAGNTRHMVFVEGDYRVKALQEADCLGTSEVFKIGYPKFDPYFSGKTFDRAGMLTRLGLDPEKKTVLFAPTFRPTCLYDVKDAIFSETTGYNLVIKLHHYSWMGKYAPHRQHRIFEKRTPRWPHARLLPVEEHDILPWLATADTLVGEASGAVVEFLGLGKIGVIYDLDHDSLTHTDGSRLLESDQRDALKGAFVHCDRPEKLGEAIRAAMDPTAEMRTKADEYRRFFFSELDGKACVRFKQTVDRLIAEGTHANVP